METAIRWSSSSTIEEQRFLLVDVAGRSFRYCKVESYDGRDLKYETISINRNVPVLRAFDWSSHDENILAVGEGSGSASVLTLDNEQSLPLSLPVRSQRPVNAVAFAKTGLLAVGLERVRNDSSLNLWDVEHRLLASTSPIASPRKSSLEPVRKYASSEGITSIKFFNDQPDTLVAGVKGACIRLYDLRESTGNPIIQFPTTSVHNIGIDHLDENYFASAGAQKDTTIHIWDRRVGPFLSAASLGSGSGHSAHSGPVLEYRRAFEGLTPAAQPQIWSLRYCRGQRGYLGALASNGDFKIFETKQAYTSEVNGHDQGGWTSNGQSLTQQKLRTGRVHHITITPDSSGRWREDIARVVAFDFTNLAGSKGRPTALILRSDKGIEVRELQGHPPAFALSSTGHLIGSGINHGIETKHTTDGDILAEAGLFQARPRMDDTHSLATTSSQRHTGPATSDGDLDRKQHPAYKWTERFSSRENHERWFEDYYLRQVTNVEAALASLNLSRRRCVRGYLFDCQVNMDVVAEDPWLQDMWGWINRTKRLAADNSLVVRGIDLSYLGVYNVWNVDFGSEKSIRISGMSGNPDILYAVEAICRSLELPELTSVESSLPAHRRLCLHICGFGLSAEELHLITRSLASQGRHTKAAALALAHGDHKTALTALRNGSTSMHRELSLALAGFVQGNTDETWTSTIADIASSLSGADAYALAILTFVRTGSWHSILSETYLPLQYRIGVALLYLPDADLTTYISTMTSECIEHGDIEGIPFTGLSEQAVPLFQSYVLKYHDLQTAILAISHTSPRYFSSPLVDIWRGEYRDLLNTYRLFIPRVRFDTGATKLSASPTGVGKPALAPPAKQVSLQCNNCDQSLDRNPAHVSISAPGPPPSSTTGSVFADHKSGTVCPKCGKHMPRCAVCMLWLGMPDPHTKGGAQMNAQALQRNTEIAKDRSGKKGRELTKDFITVCRECWHMMHAGHAEEWFKENSECPAPGCNCRCATLDAQGRE